MASTIGYRRLNYASGGPASRRAIRRATSLCLVRSDGGRACLGSVRDDSGWRAIYV